MAINQTRVLGLCIKIVNVPTWSQKSKITFDPASEGHRRRAILFRRRHKGSAMDLSSIFFHCSLHRKSLVQGNQVNVNSSVHPEVCL